jgi:hypothetical protein
LHELQGGGDCDRRRVRIAVVIDFGREHGALLAPLERAHDSEREILLDRDEPLPVHVEQRVTTPVLERVADERRERLLVRDAPRQTPGRNAQRVLDGRVRVVIETPDHGPVGGRLAVVGPDAVMPGPTVDVRIARLVGERESGLQLDALARLDVAAAEHAVALVIEVVAPDIQIELAAARQAAWCVRDSGRVPGRGRRT